MEFHDINIVEGKFNFIVNYDTENFNASDLEF